MYELQQVGPQSYYINCPAKIGIYALSEHEVYLIDSGSDKEAAKKMLKIADSKGWSIKGILNTHSNADHIGGNAFIQNKIGCPVFCSGIEADFTRHPILEPSFLYGGYPCKNLRNKFLMAKESIVTDFSSSEFPKDVETIPLPGHFFDMVGFRTLGFRCGRDIHRMWNLPLVSSIAFLAGTWLFFDIKEVWFIIYASVYLIIGWTAMGISKYHNKQNIQNN